MRARALTISAFLIGVGVGLLVGFAAAVKLILEG